MVKFLIANAHAAMLEMVDTNKSVQGLIFDI